MKNFKKGFTLIELLVVVAIIGILASVVLASLSSARTKGKDAAVESQLSSMRAQAELYSSSQTSPTYANVCTTAAASNGLGGLLSATVAVDSVTSTLNTTFTAVGAYNLVTCHDSATAWAAEAPLAGSATGASVMWCVDSTGISKKATANIAPSGTACPS
jgi:prepilin-type N-terminal cleavage/methylation domain-containing protein